MICFELTANLIVLKHVLGNECCLELKYKAQKKNIFLNLIAFLCVLDVFMVTAIKLACHKMVSRCNTERPGSRLDVFRDMADDLVTRSHEFLARPNSHHGHSMYTVKSEVRWTSRRARTITVILYFFCVTVSAVVLGLVYMHIWRPDTSKIFTQYSFCDVRQPGR